MQVQVRRVSSVPHNTTTWVEDEPTHRIVWLLEDHVTEEGARALEAKLNADERFWKLFVEFVGHAEIAAIRAV